MTQPTAGKRWLTPLCLLGLALVFAGVHHDALDGSWRFDDPYILLFAQGLPDWHSAFVHPATWQSFGIPFFTPMQTLAFQLDGWLFQTEPRLFYLHHLGVLLAITLLTFRLVQQHFGRLAGMSAGLLFLLGAPTFVISQQLMSRQYAEGLLYALLALACWLRWQRTGGRVAYTGTALFYLLAMLCKEIYAPLPLVLWALDGRGSWRQRLAHLALPTVTALVFLAWRGLMLGTLVGGYFNQFSQYGRMGQSWLALLDSFWGDGVYRWACLGAILASLLLLARRHRSRARWLLAASVAMLSLPFIAIPASPEPLQLRLAFLPWWACSLLLAVALGELAASRCWAGRQLWLAPGLAATGLLTAAALTNHAAIRVRQAYAPMAQGYDTLSRHLASHGRDQAYIPSGLAAVDLFYQCGMAGLHKNGPAGTPLSLPFAQAASALGAPATIASFDVSCVCMRPQPRVATSTPADAAALISARIERTVGSSGMRWQLASPAASPSWYLYFPRLNASLLITAQGQIGFALPPWVDTPVRVLLRLPSGQWAMTPEMPFPGRGQSLSYPASPAAPAR
jgi:hypothetical protein